MLISTMTGHFRHWFKNPQNEPPFLSLWLCGTSSQWPGFDFLQCLERPTDIPDEGAARGRYDWRGYGWLRPFEFGDLGHFFAQQNCHYLNSKKLSFV
jgi:hypothetical protein